MCLKQCFTWHSLKSWESRVCFRCVTNSILHVQGCHVGVCDNTTMSYTNCCWKLWLSHEHVQTFFFVWCSHSLYDHSWCSSWLHWLSICAWWPSRWVCANSKCSTYVENTHIGSTVWYEVNLAIRSQDTSSVFVVGVVDCPGVLDYVVTSLPLAAELPDHSLTIQDIPADFSYSWKALQMSFRILCARAGDNRANRRAEVSSTLYW